MKKIALAVCMLLVFACLFSFTGCKELENGIEIKYAKVTFTVGENETKELNFKLYNYTHKPEGGEVLSTVSKVLDKVSNGDYKDTVVNTIETSWLTFGGYKLDNNDTFVKNEKNTKTIAGQFYNNGYTGNSRMIAKGTLIMYRDFSHNANKAEAYNSATGTLAICTSASTPFSTLEYCILGNVIDSDLDVLDEIAALRNSGNDEETAYNFYYNGGLDALFTEENFKDADLDKEEQDDIKAFETQFKQKYSLNLANDDEETDFAEFKTLAEKLVATVGGNIAEYFFTTPKQTVKVTAFEVLKKKPN